MSSRRPVAILLAAGEGRRIGMPKALLELRPGVSFLGALADTFSRAGCEVLAVVGRDAERIRRSHPGLPLVRNPRWRAGQFSSVKRGLAAALARGATMLVLQPVDSPLVRKATIRRVLARAEGHDGAVPEVDGVPGHPLALTRAAAERVLRMRGVPHLRAAQERLSIARARTRDRGALLNLNTPQAYQAVLGHPPRPAEPKDAQRSTGPKVIA